MRIEVIKMTLRKRENPSINIAYQIERPLKIYGKLKFFFVYRSTIILLNFLSNFI